MGNYVSCSLSTTTKSTKVIFPGGDLRHFSAPVKAAELMLENPNFFVADSRSLKPGRRFSPLNADEDLEPASVYVMFPMKRVNSTVTAADMGALFLAAKSAARRPHFGGKGRISPESQGMNLIAPAPAAEDHQVKSVPKLNLDDIEDFSAPEFLHRLSMSMSKSKKPLLETIAEEPAEPSR